MARNLVKRNRYSGYKGMDKIGREARRNMREMQNKNVPTEELDQEYSAMDIAGNWYVEEKYAQEQLDIGTKIEMEHTDDPDVARRIASHHLFKEGIEYYANLKKMEKELEIENSENTAEMDQLKSMVETFIDFLGVIIEDEKYVMHPDSTNPEELFPVAILTINGSQFTASINNEDSGEIIIDLPNGKSFSGTTDEAARYVKQVMGNAIGEKAADSGAEKTTVKVTADMKFKSQLERINFIKALIDEKGDNVMNYSEAELLLLRTFEGLGGQANNIEDINQGILDQFYTPYSVIEKMWGLAIKFGFSFGGKKRILEPSCGIGRFFEYIPEGHDVVGYEIDKYAYTIAKLTFPKANIQNDPFETHFWDTQRNIKKTVKQEFDLVIGNPPYRPLDSKYTAMKDVVGMSEKDYTGTSRFEHYMLVRGVDVLKPGGLLIFIIPNSFLYNGSQYNAMKNELAKKADLVDAYRLPNGVFGNTQIGTDIVVLKRK